MKKILMYLLVLIFVSDIAQSQVARRFDVIIHELFPDPTPVIGLPGSEFIELRNISSATFNLRNWKITDGSSSAVVTVNYMLQPDSFVVICPSSAVQAFSVFGSTIGVTSFPSLNNDADIITLISPEARIIHSLSYDLSWYKNAVKSEGGWTLEMIDARNPCGGIENWRASSNTKGGTPGRSNAVEAINPDADPPALIRTYNLDSITIVAVFDEPLDSFSAAGINNYSIDKALTILQVHPLPPLFREVKLIMNAPLVRDEVYTLQVMNVADCTGNTIGALNNAKTGLPSVPQAGDIVINELLFNPKPDGTDYVECWNRGNTIIDASMLLICNRNSAGAIGSIKKLSEIPFLVFPGDHIVVAADAKAVQKQYSVKNPQHLLTVDPMPSMPDDKGTIVLLDQQGTIIDEVPYDEKWHFPLIAQPEGVALERIDGKVPAQLSTNWTSAASDAGYGTPTRRNSQYKSAPALQAKIEISPAVFSPDNNGTDDHCFIHYQFSEPNNVARVTIFDMSGHAVRNLARNATLSEKGFFRWDGLDDKNNPLPIGIYIVLTELFTVDGNKKFFKNPVTLAHPF
ncbi:MAG: lamin tail domain-containing protein [Chitinophagaceae bacterium]